MSRFLKLNEPVLVWTGKAVLDGRLTVPREAAGVVLMPSLAGTCYHDAYRALAATFHENDFATLACDLLTPEEQQLDVRTGHYRADVPFIATRLNSVVSWIGKGDLTRDLPVAVFAAGAPALAVLHVDAARDAELFAAVLTPPRLIPVDGLEALRTPTLLIVTYDLALQQIACSRSVAADPERHVEVLPDEAPLLDGAASVDRIGRKTMVWLRQHAPVAA